MLTLTPPAAVGLDPKRLANIGPHLDRYVDDGNLPGYMVMVARRGRPAYLRLYGQRDVERGLPVQEDTIFRIYSMTKPITSVALLQLYEKGLFQLDNPVSRFIPAFKDLQVYTGGDGDNLQTTFHLGLYITNELVGICSFFKNNHPLIVNASQYQLRGMAILDAYQGLGLGTLILSHGETLLKQQGIPVIWCNARVKATEFYNKMGYKIIGEPFDIKDIGLHYCMYKPL